MIQRACALVTCAACGAGADPSSTDGGDQNPTTISIERTVSGNSELLALRDGSQTWQSLDPAATEFVVTSERYQLAAVCLARRLDGSVFRIVTASRGRVVGDGPSVKLPCRNTMASSPPARTTITGQMTEPGTVVLDGFDESETGPWNFEVTATPGVHHLIAHDTSRVAFRRDVTVAAEPLALAPITLAQEGAPWERLDLTLDGTSSDEFGSAGAWLQIGDSTAITSVPSSTAGSHQVLLAPSGSLRADDRQTISLYASTQTGLSRGVYIDPYTGAEPTRYTLLPHLEIVRAGRSFSWDSLPEHDTIFIASLENNRFEWLDATSGWTRVVNIADTDYSEMPGWDPAWNADPDALAFSVSVEKAPSPNVNLSSVASFVPFATRQTPSPELFSRHQRLVRQLD